ncbi:MAG: ATP-binding protein [Blautia wexlerae]
MNESDIDKIFNRFYTTDLSRSRKTTGLGLTIAKNLTVKMGGSISASLNNNVFEIVVCFPKQKDKKLMSLLWWLKKPLIK